MKYLKWKFKKLEIYFCYRMIENLENAKDELNDFVTVFLNNRHMVLIPVS